MELRAAGGLRRVALVKHSAVEIDERRPAHEWRLSLEGRRRAASIAPRLRHLAVSRVVSSREPKASETARIVARDLGVPVEERDGLHEHARATVPFLGATEFERAIRELFARPHELVFGEETADAARRRFSRALDALMSEGDGDEIVVTHGTVIALDVAARSRIDTYLLWRHLGLPSIVHLSWPDTILRTEQVLDASS